MALQLPRKLDRRNKSPAISYKYKINNKMITKLEKTVSEDGFDLCVSCDSKTPYKIETRIDMRNFYVECAGQLCETCYEKTFGGNADD